ncbi:MAG: methionyl-tRNA formyltransferase [Candidatus Binatia bacterium]
MKLPLRLVFFGTPDFAVPSLRVLLTGSDTVVGVVCQPDKPAGRGQRLTAPPIKQLAVSAGVPLLQPTRLRADEFADALRAWSPDLVVVAAYGKFLPQRVLDLPPHGCINVHASLLPKYRGAAPIQWAILRGEDRTGVTIMRMNERLDAGNVLLQRATAIGRDETYGELQARLAVLGAQALAEVMTRLHAGPLAGTPQREADATLAPMIKKDDGCIDWTQAACAIARMVRAFNPWPSAYTHLAGRRVKVHRAHVIATTPAASPGTVTAVGSGIAVATGEGTLVVDELQLEGRKRLTAAEFARGGGVQIGTMLGG